MTDNLTVEVVPTGTEDASSGSDTGDELGLLMPRDAVDRRMSLDPDPYPYITAHVAVEDDVGPVDDIEQQQFSVFEGEEERDIQSFEPVNDTLDLAFVFDDTGSMSSEIDGAKAGVTDLTDAIDRMDIDARYALVTFKDSTDEVEVDHRFTTNAGRLKSAVDDLRATGGGPAPEANFDAIERALGLNWRDDARRVIVDITDAPSRHRDDGSGKSDCTFSEVASDVQTTDTTLLSVAPDEENKTSSVKSLTAEVGGLWTDISGLRYASEGAASERFEDVLDRISSLLSSTYELTYASCAPPGEKTPVTIECEHPSRGTAADTATLSVRSEFELPARCLEDTGTVEGSGVTLESDPSLDVADCVELKSETSRVELPPEGGRIQVLLTLLPGSSARVAERQVVLCLDESRSMEESLGTSDQSKMYHATAAAKEALASLSDTDHVGLVAFENTPEVVSEIGTLERVGRDTLTDAIDSLEPGGGTDVLSALKLARGELEKLEAGPEQARRILLLSDGADRFELSTFTDLATEVADLEASVLAGGIGPEYDEEVMLALADGSHGNAAHLETPEDVETFVHRSIVDTARLVAANPSLELDISPVFQFHNVFCHTPETKPRDIEAGDSPQTVPLPDLLADEPQTVVFEVLAPPRAEGTTHEIGDAALVVGGETVAETTLSVEYTTDPEPENSDVVVAYEEARITGALREGADPEDVDDDIDALPEADGETIDLLRERRDAVADDEAGSRIRAGLPPAEDD